MVVLSKIDTNHKLLPAGNTFYGQKLGFGSPPHRAETRALNLPRARGMLCHMMRALLLLLSLSACAQFPEVDAGARTNLPTPNLLPTDQLITGVNQTTPADPLAGPVATLNARAAALRAESSSP